MHTRTLSLGILFGFVLSRAGATSYDAIRGMFRLTDLHLMGVIGTAVAISAIAFALIRKNHWKTVSGQAITLTEKPMVRGLALGSLLFGAGWALTGTCPGTALAQIGEGRVSSIVTFMGILTGAYAGERLARRDWHVTCSLARRPGIRCRAEERS